VCENAYLISDGKIGKGGQSAPRRRLQSGGVLDTLGRLCQEPRKRAARAGTRGERTGHRCPQPCRRRVAQPRHHLVKVGDERRRDDDHPAHVTVVDTMTRYSVAMRTAWIVLAFVLAAAALVGCATSTDRSAVAPTRAVPSPTVNVSSRPILSPTPSTPPDVVQGPLTKPVPGGVTTVTVSFLQPGGDSGTVVYRTTVTSPTDIRTLVDAVDALHVTGSYSKGCSMSPVDLRLDFVSPGHASTFVEDSSCRYATLTIDGSAGPKLDSAELGVAEETVRETAVTGPDGQVSISAAPASSAS